ncbi:MAG: NADH-quinone oxidoreductase subunit J [Chloroflexales bacterium]|nr:NADH-quinone oxidoreductase subunit J [Chloroflexales bacterium]
MEQVMFFITALIALVGAVAMLISRNAVHSALFLLLNFGAIAVLFLLLLSPFLFVVQLTVYAGAIMVLFLFVVMLLGAERAEDEQDRIAWQRPLALVLGLVLLGQAIFVFAGQLGQVSPQITIDESFADPAKIGEVLFTTYLLPFQITGFILLIAIIGVVVLNQRARLKHQG